MRTYSIVLGGSISYSLGCPIKGIANKTLIAAAIAAVKKASVAFLTLGTNSEVAEEGIDALTMVLPGDQAMFAQAILAVGKPTIVVLFNGGTLSIDAIANWKIDLHQPIAIIESFFPGQSVGEPVSQHIFGAVNRWGKFGLAITK